MECHGHSGVLGIVGLLFLIVGYLLWSGSWTLEQGIGAVIILVGLVHLLHGVAPTPFKAKPAKRKRR